jgi:hypothetical protein
MWPLATYLEVYQYQMSIWSLLLWTFPTFHFEKRFQRKKFLFYFCCGRFIVKFEGFGVEKNIIFLIQKEKLKEGEEGKQSK